MAQAKLSMADALQRLHAHVIASAEGKISSTTGVGKFYLQAGPDGAMIKEAFKVAGGLKKVIQQSGLLPSEVHSTRV